jgi:penicillin V acylase-like amidase (Ntn superfamily)
LAQPTCFWWRPRRTCTEIVIFVAGADAVAAETMTIPEGLKTWQIKIPRNYREALNSPEKELWQEASLGKVSTTYLPMKLSYQPPFSTKGITSKDQQQDQDNEVSLSEKI